MRNNFLNRTTGTIAAAMMLVAFAQPATAQSSRAQIDAEMNRIGYDYPGPALVFAGCALTAANEYNATGSTDSALGVLVGCAAVGCAFTNDYRNCINVNTRLFLLSIARR